MTSRLQAIARAVYELSAPSAERRQQVQSAARAARQLAQRSASVGRDSAEVTASLQLAEKHLATASDALSSFGADAKAFSAHLAGGSSGGGSFSRTAPTGTQSATAARLDLLRKIGLSFVSPEVASGWVPTAAGKIAKMGANVIHPGSGEALEDIVEQAVDASFTAIDEGIPHYFALRAEATFDRVLAGLGKKGNP